MAKKNNKRKFAALALGIVGVAGLSLASAAQINVTENSPLVGVSTGNECDDAVTVNYTTNFVPAGTPKFQTSQILVTDIAAACSGKDLTVWVLDNADGVVGATAGYTATVTGTSLTLPVSPGLNAQNIYQAAVSIS